MKKGQKEISDKAQEFDLNLLNEQQREDYAFVIDRIQQLQEVRKDQFGTNLDRLFAEADRDYIPHRLKTTGQKIIAADDDKGWRGRIVELGSSNWQSDVSQVNPFVKIQIALSILVDQNPSGVFTPNTEKYQATTELTKQLYQRSWEVARSRGQLKLFVFNLAKYGWAVARTYPLKIERDVKVITEYNEDNPQNSTYEKKTVCEYNNIFRENLDPRNTWIDDMAKPNNPQSVRDWAWRKVYDYNDLEGKFGSYPFFKYVKRNSGIITDTIDERLKNGKDYKGKELVEVYFYESKTKDLFVALFGGKDGIPVILDPLPISDADGSKKLSLWQTYWNLRHGECPYGVGIYEAIRYDQALLDRIDNMSIDQLVLSIYKMFFYQGTQNLQGDGKITIEPGVGKQVIDPKSVTWLQVPGPGRESIEWRKAIRDRLDEGSGITDPLLGIVSGGTAYGDAQAREAALKRLKNPLDNILEALTEEAYLTVAIGQLIYSIPEVYEITDQRLIEDYLKEIENDPELYEESYDENGNRKFSAKVYREFPMNLDKDERGNLIETQESKFFRIKPKYLKWQGIVNIKAQSILAPSKQIEKALDLEFYNMFLPLLQTLDQERAMAEQFKRPMELDNLPHGKAAKSLCKLYDKDPRDVFPDYWFEKPDIANEGEVAQGGEVANVPQGTQPQEQLPQDQQSQQDNQSLFVQGNAPEAEKAVSQVESIPERPTSLVGKIMSRLSRPFRR